MNNCLQIKEKREEFIKLKKDKKNLESDLFTLYNFSYCQIQEMELFKKKCLNCKDLYISCVNKTISIFNKNIERIKRIISSLNNIDNDINAIKWKVHEGLKEA